MKVIRPVERYIESAEIEIEILEKIAKVSKELSEAGHKVNSKCVRLVDHFFFKDQSHEYLAMIFEHLGPSLYEFISSNNYWGNHL